MLSGTPDGLSPIAGQTVPKSAVGLADNAKSAAWSAALSATRKEERKNEKEEGIKFI